jgi:hypothetical protein
MADYLAAEDVAGSRAAVVAVVDRQLEQGQH